MSLEKLMGVLGGVIVVGKSISTSKWLEYPLF